MAIVVSSVPVRSLLCTLGTGDYVCFNRDGIGDDLSVLFRDISNHWQSSVIVGSQEGSVKRA